MAERARCGDARGAFEVRRRDPLAHPLRVLRSRRSAARERRPGGHRHVEARPRLRRRVSVGSARHRNPPARLIGTRPPRTCYSQHLGMSLRTRLILAFVLLSVVPLSAVTLYSYSTSVHAFQRAVEREAQQSAADIGHRMTMVTDDLGRRMDQMFEGTSGSSAHDAQPATSEEMRARVAP